MGKKADEFADAVRLLLWGNGDLNAHITDLQKLLEKHDGVANPGANKLTQLANHIHPADYRWYSYKWNKIDDID